MSARDILAKGEADIARILAEAGLGHHDQPQPSFTPAPAATRYDPRAPQPVTQAPAPEPEPMAAAPAAAEPETEAEPATEDPMSLSDQLAPLNTLAGRLDALGGDDAVTKLETVRANPDGNRGFEAVAALSGRGQLSAAAVAMVSALEALAAQPQ